MARIRTIKPEFWTDSKIVALPPLARLLFIGLWNFADDEGRMPYEPVTIKLQILPLDPTDLSEEIGALRRNSMLVVYEVDGKQYLQISNFEKHQKVDKRKPSKLPPPPIRADSRRIPPNGPAGREGNGMEGNGGEGIAPPHGGYSGAVIDLSAEQFAELQRTYHSIPDFRAELSSIDIKFFHERPVNWYATLCRWLNGKHQRTLAEKAASDPGKPSVPKGDYAKRNVETIR